MKGRQLQDPRKCESEGGHQSRRAPWKTAPGADPKHHGLYYNRDKNTGAGYPIENNQECLTDSVLCTSGDNDPSGGPSSQSQGQSEEQASSKIGATSGGKCADPGLRGSGERGVDGGGSAVASLWAALSALRERMRSPRGAASGNGQTADRHQSSSTTTAQTTNNFQTTCTTSTTASDTTIQDILSVKNISKKEILPPLARKLAKAATLTAAVMAPMKEIFSTIENRYDLVEVACSPTSTLTATFEANGYQCLRVNYNLDTKAGTDALKTTLSKAPTPKLVWISLPCTTLSSLQNLTERTPEQLAKFQKRRGQDLRRADEVSSSLDPVLHAGGDIGWEWPTRATSGWRSGAIARLRRLCRKHRRHLYEVRVDGCAYGLEWRGEPLLKQWTILTTSKQMWLELCRRCPGNHSHAECRGPAAQASSYYPVQLCKAVLRAMKHQWLHDDLNLTYLTEKHILQVDENMLEYPENLEEENVFALSRTKLNLEIAPTGKKLEAVKQLMMRVHRASGHSGFSNLQALLKARGSPDWAIALAGTLECPECREAARPKPSPPASTGEEPQLFEILGSDAFEYEALDKKYFGLLWRDRASGLTMIDMMKETELGERWSPSSQDVIRSFLKWMSRHPAPR